MPLAPRSLALVLVLLLVPWVGALPAHADDEPTAWENEVLLQEAFTKGCAAVEAFCGVAYPETPTLKVSTVAEVAGILRAEFASAREGMAEVVQEASDAMLVGLATGLLAKYEPSTNIVHVLSDNVGRLAKLIDIPELESEAVMRVVMAHEAVHALDFQRFPNLEQGLQTLTDSDARMSLSSVIEGHAQYASRAIAVSWDMEDAWQTYTTSITAEVPGLEGAMRLVARTTAASVAFAYLQGYTFMTAVAEARGREGLDAALAKPPTSTRVIERPELWLDPDSVPEEVDLEDALGILRAALEELGCSTTSQRVLEAQIAVQFGVLPPEEREQAMALLDEARALVGQCTDPVFVAIGAVLRMKDVAAARAWRDVTDRLSRLKDAQFTTGAVQIESAEYEELEHEPGNPALRVRKVVKIPTGSQEVVLLCYPVSRYVLELTLIDVPEEAMSRIEEAVQRTLAGLHAPETLKAPEPEPVPAGAE